MEMRKGSSIHIENGLAFKKISEAIAFKVAENLVHRAYRDFEHLEGAIYPCEGDDCTNILLLVEIIYTFTVDDIELIQFRRHDELYWTTSFKK